MSWLGFPGSSAGKESTCNAGDTGPISGLRISLGGGSGNPLQYPCLGNPHGEQPGGLQSMGLQRVRHNQVTKHSTAQVLAVASSGGVWLCRIAEWRCPVNSLLLQCEGLGLQGGKSEIPESGLGEFLKRFLDLQMYLPKKTSELLLPADEVPPFLLSCWYCFCFTPLSYYSAPLRPNGRRVQS